MQKVTLQKAPPVRTPSYQDIERARIYAEYAKRNPPPEVEIEDPDDPRYFMDAEELQTFYKEKLERESKETQQDHRAATMARIYKKSLPEPEEVEEDYDDGRPVTYRAMDRFLAANPKYANEAGYKRVANTAAKSMHDDIYKLREKFNKTESRADAEALFARAAEISEYEMRVAEQRKAVEKMAKDRFPILG